MLLRSLLHYNSTLVSSVITQGLPGSWKTWEVLEFYFVSFQDWKVLEICLTQAIKFSEFML